jgi:NADPH:quinone reductase-like Zn-dependent oxidoreductase
MGIGALPFLLAMLLQLVFGLNPFASGMITFTSAVGALTMKFTVGPIVRRFGQMAVQLAVARGARVIGTASPARHDVVRALGAEPVAYGDGLADRVRALATDGVDAAIDTVGTDEAVDVSLELVADRNRIASIAAFARGAAAGIKLLGGGPGADPGDEIRDAARLELIDLVAAGALSVSVAATYPLTEAAAAHRAILTGHTTGKIALVP